MIMRTDNTEQARELINARIDQLSPELRDKVNKPLHENPETAFKEFFAHKTLTAYLESLGFKVKRSTYGLETSFEATTGQGGRQVVFCAEYDALPEIGHACGHNLIATSSFGAFLGLAHAMSTLQLPGRLRLLGTPAEEGAGGKAKLIDAGAFNPTEDIAAAIMAHPTSQQLLDGKSPFPSDFAGLAGFKTLASHKFRVEFRGKTAHAAAHPWKGVNALDAAVSAYQNAAMLRQQIQPDERIHAVFEVGGSAQNIITDYTRMSWNVRSPTIARADQLLERVKNCIEAGAKAAGCEVSYNPSPTSINLRANETLCRAYAEDMARLGKNVVPLHDEPAAGSTDMGNVSHIVPSFHGTFTIPTSGDCPAHNPKFAAAAATEEAHAAAMTSAKGMAMLAFRVLTDDTVADGAKKDFETPDERQ